MSRLRRSQRRKDLEYEQLFHKAWTTALTESTEYRVGESIPDRQFPLRSNDQAKRGDEEEIRNEDIVCRDASPFHQTQREGGQGGTERPER